MADEQIVTSIVAKADLSSLVSEVHRASASLQQLQRELLASNKAISSSTKLANNLFRDTLTGSGQFSSHFVNLNSDVDKFGKNLDAGRLKLKNYFSTFREHTTTQKGMIRELAKEQVMLQNSVLQPLGRNAQGLMQYNVMIPRGLDAVANSGKLARMEMQIMNRALSEGAGSLINWGKNTQWAGRQLTVGLTVPLTMFGAAAGKAFKEADQELVRLTKVYGGLAATSASDLKAIREEVVETAKTLSKTMGASFKDTIALGADIAATGQTGNELLGSIAETTRLAILGEVDRQDAMKATLSIQTAFKQNTQELTESINFLNAVENQTSTTLNDLVEAIPKAGPVIQQLGGDVKDLALYLTAMREGGISASEGANALKSGLASLINPTKQTVGMMSDFGIDVMGMVAKNTGDTTGLLMDLQKALDSLDPLSKARAMEQMFGKFQFARMSALLNNLGKQGSQTLQVLDLMKASTADLASIASRELKMVTESASGKYKRAIEGLKAELADVGEEFLGVATKLISAATKILDFFTKLPDPIKKGLTFLAGFTALVGPLIMLTGLLANFFGYITKGVVQLRAFFMKANGWKMLTPEIIAAEKAALLVENAFYSDAAAAQVLHNALQKLVLDYQNLQAASMKNAVPVNAGVTTVGGAPVIVGGRRVVDSSNPYVGDPNTRAMSHINPRDPNNPATIFGGVPGAIPVNRGISRTPQMYMPDRLPNIEGLTSVKGISTGIVPAEAAKFHALMATLGMQTEQEVAMLKKTIAMGGTVSADLLGTFDDILPITQKFANSAAEQSALIVQQMRNAEITVEQAKARILALNAQIEADMGSAVTAYAAGRGRTIDLTKAPMMNQPVVDANGQFTLRDLYKKKANASVMEEFGRLRGVRTFGAPYSMHVTRMPKFNTGGEVESFSANKTVVSGPSSVGYDDRLGSVPLGGYVLNQAASMDPANAALVAMAPSTYLNDGGNITAALTPREVVFGPQIQKMPELYAAVDAANNGYNFGGQIMNGVTGYGKKTGNTPQVENKAYYKRRLREYLKFINNPRYADDMRIRMIMLDAAELVGKGKIPVDKAINIATSNFDIARTKSGGSIEKFIDIRIKQVQGLEGAKDANGKLKFPGLKLNDSTNTRSTGGSQALNYELNNVRSAMLKNRKFKDVFDLIEGVTPTDIKNAKGMPYLEGLHARGHITRHGNVGYATSGHMGVAAIIPSGINSIMARLQDIGISPDILHLTGEDARKNFQVALKSVGMHKMTTVDDIATALEENNLFKTKAQIASGNIVRATPKQRNDLQMFLEAVMSRKRWVMIPRGRPPIMTPVLAKLNKGGMIPGGSISRGRSNYGNISPLLKLIAPSKQLEILQKAREMAKATATGSYKDLAPVKYGHMVAPSSGMSYPIPGVSGLYKDTEGRLKFFKGVPNEISAKAEIYGTRMAREVFGLDAPEQTIKTILNPLDPTGKTKLLGLESPFDKKFAGGGTVFTEDEMIRQTIASLVMNNKDLSPSNVYGNVLADVGAAGVFPKASGNSDFAKTLPSMQEQAMINLLAVKGGARKDFAVNTSHLAGNMTAKQYERKMKAAMKKIHPKLIKFVATLPREDRAPYIKLLQRFEDGMEQTDFKTLHGVHVAAKRNSGGPIGGGSIQRGRYAYGAKNKKGSQRSGNPAKRAEEERLRAARTASYNAPSASGYTASGNPQMQVVQVPYVGGTGVAGNAFGGLPTGQSQQTIDTLRLSQIGQLPAGVTRAFDSLTKSIKVGTVGLRYGIATSGTYLSSAYKDFAKSQVMSARTNASFLSNWVKTNTRDIKEGILRNQARSTFAAYPGANYLMGPGQIMPVSMSGPGMVGDWKETGQDGTKSRKVGTFGYRKREYMGPDGYIHDSKSAKAAGLDTRIRGGMGMPAQMGIGMAGNMGGMYLMQQEKVNMLGMEMSGMNAGLGLMAASTIIPMIHWKTVGHSIKTFTTNTMTAIKSAKSFKDGISAVGAQLGKYIKILKGVGVVLSVVTIGFDWWKKYNNAQQDAAMSLGITKDGAKQAGIEYFNLNNYLTEYIEKQKLANAAAQGSRNSGIGMPGIPQSIEDMKKAKEEGAALKDLIESINRTSTTGELQTLVNNQKAQFIAGGLSVEQANRMIYGAIANSEKASDAYKLLADGGFGAITDKATAAEFAVKNLLETLERDPKTGASKGSFAYNLVAKQPMWFTKEWNEQNSLLDKAWDITGFGLIDRYKNAFADTNAYKKGVISGLESVISTFDASTKALIGTKNETGEVIDEYEAYQITLKNLEKDMPNFNVALGEETFAIIEDMSPELAKITNKFDSIKSILAKIKLSTSGIGLDLKYLDGDLAIKLAGFTAAVGEGIDGLTKAAESGSTYGSVGKVLDKLQKSIAATSAASQKAAAASQRSIQEELKLIAKKISLIEDEKNKKLESLRATQDASNYALELQKLQIEYADAISRGDQAGAARARIEIDQLTSNRQTDLTQKAIEDEANRLKAIEQKKADAAQAKADAEAAKFQGAQDNATSASEIANLIKGFKDTYDEITTSRITNNLLPDSQAKRIAEQAIIDKLSNLLKQIGVAGTGNSQTAKEVRAAFADYFNKDGTVKGVYKESKPTGLPDATTTGIVPRVAVDKDTTSIFDRDVAAVTKFADQITGGKGYSIKKMTEEIVAAIKGGGTSSDPIFAGTSKAAIGQGTIDWNTPVFNDRKAVKYFAQKKGYLPGQQFTLQESNGVKKQFLVLNDGNIQYVRSISPTYADGGKVRGPGTGTSDSIPAMLSHGEYVIKASSVAKYGVRAMDEINAGRFADGGQVQKFSTGGQALLKEIAKDPTLKDIQSPLGTAKRFIDTAISQLGVEEEVMGSTWGEAGNNVTKYSRWLTSIKDIGAQAFAWCGTFVQWAAHMSGVKIPNTFYTANGAKSFAGLNQLVDVATKIPTQIDEAYASKGFRPSPQNSDFNVEYNYDTGELSGNPEDIERYNKAQDDWYLGYNSYLFDRSKSRKSKAKAGWARVLKNPPMPGDIIYLNWAMQSSNSDTNRIRHAAIATNVKREKNWSGEDSFNISTIDGNVGDKVSSGGYNLSAEKIGENALVAYARPNFIPSPLTAIEDAISAAINQRTTHVVEKDQTLSQIAKSLKIDSKVLAELNPNYLLGNTVYKGTRINIPKKFADGGMVQAFGEGGGPGLPSWPKKRKKFKSPGMGIDKITPPLIGSGASAAFGGLLGGGGGMMLGYHDGGPVHPHPHKNKSDGNFFSRFNPVNAFSSMLGGWANLGASQAVNTSTNIQSQLTQQEKDYLALQTAQMFSGYTSAFNLKNNTSPEIAGSQKLGTAADVLGVLPLIGGLGKLTKLSGLAAKSKLVTPDINLKPTGPLSSFNATKYEGKKINPKNMQKFLSDVLGDVSLPAIKTEKLGPGIAGMYVPRFADKSSNYENLLPHILFNSKYKVSGQTAVHETMHHFDMEMHDSFKRTLEMLRKSGKDNLADRYESIYVNAEKQQKGLGFATWEDYAVGTKDIDSIAWSNGAAEAFAEENTFKAYSNFMNSKSLKDKIIASKIGNTYGPGLGTDNLRGYFKTFRQFEQNALALPLRLNPSFLKGFIDNSPNMPEKTKTIYQMWQEGLEEFNPAAYVSTPSELPNSVQYKKFKDYITSYNLDRAKGYHKGGPVGHKHETNLPQHASDMMRGIIPSRSAPHNIGMQEFGKINRLNVPHDMGMKFGSGESGTGWDFNYRLPKFTDNNKPESLKEFALNQLKVFGSSYMPGITILGNIMQRIQSRETGLGINSYEPDDPNNYEDGATVNEPYYSFNKYQGYGKVSPVYLDVQDFTQGGRADRQKNISSIYEAANELTRETGVPFRVIRPKDRAKIMEMHALNPYSTKVLKIKFLDRADKKKIQEGNDGIHSLALAWNDQDSITLPRAVRSNWLTTFNNLTGYGAKSVAKHEIVHSFQSEDSDLMVGGNINPLGQHSFNPFNLMNGFGFAGTILSNSDIEFIRQSQGYYKDKYLDPKEVKAIERKIQIAKGSRFANGGLAQNFSNSAFSNLGVPMFENGINMVPANMLAMLHKDEAVIPANMNPFNPNASAAVSGSVYNINVELNGTNVTAQDVATQIHKEMRLKEMAAGVNRRVGNG